MPTIEEIDAQIAALTKEREATVKAERDADLETVKQLCKKHNFYASDIGTALKKRKKRAASAK